MSSKIRHVAFILPVYKILHVMTYTKTRGGDDFFKNLTKVFIQLRYFNEVMTRMLFHHKTKMMLGTLLHSVLWHTMWSELISPGHGELRLQSSDLFFVSEMSLILPAFECRVSAFTDVAMGELGLAYSYNMMLLSKDDTTWCWRVQMTYTMTLPSTDDSQHNVFEHIRLTSWCWIQMMFNTDGFTTWCSTNMTYSIMFFEDRWLMMLNIGDCTIWCWAYMKNECKET